jgi:hypothetical protein
MRAALQKTKGDRAAAERLLAEARADRSRRRAARGHVEFRPPTPAHAERAAWREFTDDQLADAMGATEDDAVLERIVAELERRDAAERKATAQRERRRRARDARDGARQTAYDEALAAGEDPEEAYARIWSVSEATMARERALELLSDVPGKSFRAKVKQAHAEHIEERYVHAEGICRGHMLSPAGQRAGVSAASLFSGPAARAKKYASPELLDYFREHGRTTLEDFTADLLGGQHRHRTAGDDW